MWVKEETLIQIWQSHVRYSYSLYLRRELVSCIERGMMVRWAESKGL